MNHRAQEFHKEHRGLDASSDRLSAIVVDAGLAVHRRLAPGLLESADEHCLAHEFDLRGVAFERRAAPPVIYEQIRLEAACRLDLPVENTIKIEIKSADSRAPVHRSQLLTDLRLSRCRLGLLMYSMPYSSSRCSRD